MSGLVRVGEQNMKVKVIRLLQDKQIKILEGALSGDEHDQVVAVEVTHLLIELSKQIEQL